MEEDPNESGCPYCNYGWGCKHFYFQTEDGHIIDKPSAYDELTKLINEAFSKALKRNTSNIQWRHDSITQMWKVICEYGKGANHIDIEDFVDDQTLATFFIDTFSKTTDTSGEEDLYGEETPGLTGFGGSYFAKDVRAVERLLKNKFCELLTPFMGD